MSERIARLEQEAAQLKVGTSPSRDGLYQAVGAVAMVAGVVVAFVAYQMSLGKDDPRDIQSLIILAVAMLALAIIGAAVFLRYSLARFLRFWLLRQLYESQAHIDRVVGALAPGAPTGPTAGGAPTAAGVDDGSAAAGALPGAPADGSSDIGGARRSGRPGTP
jgi:hypothetical protein